MEWILSNWLPLTIILISILVIIGIIVYLCKKNGLKQVAYQAILLAEEHYNSTTGQERLDLAINYMYSKLINKFPIISNIIPESLAKSAIRIIIQKIFDEIKLVLDYQKPQINEEGGNS